jgi:hypothetical protein
MVTGLGSVITCAAAVRMLQQRQQFKQLIHSAQAPRQEDERSAVIRR